MRNLLLAVMLVITGCSQSISNDNKRELLGIHALEASVPCCVHFSELSFLPITPDEKISFSISKDNESFKFVSGKSFVASFDISAIENIDAIEIISPIRNSVFLPLVKVLDENYIPIAISNEHDLTRDKAHILNEDHYLLTLSMAKSQVKPHYIIIFTSSSLIENTTSRLVPKAIVAETGQTIANQNLLMNPTVPHSATGRLSMRFKYKKEGEVRAEKPLIEVFNSKDGSFEYSSLEDYREQLTEYEISNYGVEIINAVERGYFEKALSFTNKAQDKELARSIFTKAIKINK